MSQSINIAGNGRWHVFKAEVEEFLLDNATEDTKPIDAEEAKTAIDAEMQSDEGRGSATSLVGSYQLGVGETWGVIRALVYTCLLLMRPDIRATLFADFFTTIDLFTTFPRWIVALSFVDNQADADKLNKWMLHTPTLALTQRLSVQYMSCLFSSKHGIDAFESGLPLLDPAFVNNFNTAEWYALLNFDNRHGVTAVDVLQDINQIGIAFAGFRDNNTKQSFETESVRHMMRMSHLRLIERS